MQSGCYVDYLIKQLAEMVVRNVFVYAALFFGEKFIVEFCSKKVIDNLITDINTHLLNRQYNNRQFFTNLIIFTIIFLF